MISPRKIFHKEQSLFITMQADTYSVFQLAGVRALAYDEQSQGNLPTRAISFNHQAGQYLFRLSIGGEGVMTLKREAGTGKFVNESNPF